jgi:hypothetical protein
MELLNFLATNTDSLATVGLVVGGSFALWRWIIEQRWRRVQYASQLLEKFFENNNTKKALMMLDATTEVELFPDKADPSSKNCYVDEELLIEALRPDMSTSFSSRAFAVRLVFDQFFTDLSMFQHHIDANLLRLEDVRPYLEYWLKSINGHGPVFEQVHSIALAEQINKFLHAFGYNAILKLSQAMDISLRTVPAGTVTAASAR